MTPDKIKAMRERDAKDASSKLTQATAMVRELERAIGVWADSVRATAELRHEAGAADAVLWADTDYKAALDAMSAVAAAKERLEVAFDRMVGADQLSEDIAKGDMKP